ncbi:DUF4401 domain-containing protein [Arcticibacter sp. MXS-1]|uniref:DUF4401 domain-containing protein n=1 Tax=Arcticibacter sp. MXS-1 TaxID=3341726 RepID=UPI0035A81B9C
MNDQPLDELLAKAASDGGEDFRADLQLISAEVGFRSSMYSGLGVKVLSVVGGLLASLSFTGFLFSAELIRSGVSMLVFGLFALAGSIIVNRYVKNLTLDTAVVSANVIGYISVAIGLNDLTRSDNLQAVTLLILAVLTLFLSESFMLVLIAVIVACNCALALFLINDAQYFIFLLSGALTLAYTHIHLKEAFWIAKGRRWNKLYTPVRIGVLLSFLILLGVLSRKEIFVLFRSPLILSSALIGMGSIFTVWTVLRRMGDKARPMVKLVIVFSALVLLPGLVSPAVSGAILVLLVSFYTSHRNAFFLGLIVLIYSVATYYYDLEYSLLTKSAILFGSGLVFLVAWIMFKRKLRMYEEA